MDAMTVSALLNGGTIVIDAEMGTLEFECRRAARTGRRKAWKAPPNPYQSGAFRKYADRAGPARKGAVTHSGGAKEAVCHAEV